MAAPTFVASYSTAYETTVTTKTMSVTTQAGDVLVVYGLTESEGISINSIAGNSLSYNLHQSIQTGGYCEAFIWSATDSTGGTNWTLTATANTSGLKWGATCLVFRDSDGVGASNKTNASSGGQTVSLTTTQVNSAIVMAHGDWNAADGASRTWATVNGVTPNSGNGLERTYSFTTGNYTAYGGYYNDAGSVGAKAVGVTAPTGQKYSIVALEVLGQTSSAPSVTTNAVTGIGPTSATGNGSVDADGGNTITERGFCWGTSANPTTAGSKVTVAGTTGSYSGSLTSLSDATTYHVRAYAINAIGTSYGDDVTFINLSATVAWLRA